MSIKKHDNGIHVPNEIGTLRALLIHSPDSGLGKVVPSKAQDWLFEDIVHLDTVRKAEYDYYLKVLMYFLDPEKIKGKLREIDSEENDRAFYKPDHPDFHSSDKVLELQQLLAEILENEGIRKKLTASVCAIEGCTYRLQQELIATDARLLAKIFISGTLPDERMIFAPIPNLIFTRDVGITINNFVLLNKPAKKARSRETLLMRYIFFNHPHFAACRENILEIPDPLQHFLRPGEDEDHRTTLEGGDVMVVSPGHVLIGCSERTSPLGANEAIKLLFQHEVVEKVTVVKIPNKRDFMHIDTIFTQVKRNVWVVLSSVSRQGGGVREPIHLLVEQENRDKTEIIQFRREDPMQPKRFESIESLLDDISRNDLGSQEETRFIYSGNDTFPYDAREQWTDSCNLLAVREGVVLGYDRNDNTIQAFKKQGFDVIHVATLIDKLENGEVEATRLKDTLILMPSAELSRARGGFHCMSLPIRRDSLDLTV